MMFNIYKAKQQVFFIIIFEVGEDLNKDILIPMYSLYKKRFLIVQSLLVYYISKFGILDRELNKYFKI